MQSVLIRGAATGTSCFDHSTSWIFNTRLKKLLLVVFCCNLRTLYSKNCVIISVVAAKIWCIKKCTVFIGPPCMLCRLDYRHDGVGWSGRDSFWQGLWEKRGRGEGGRDWGENGCPGQIVSSCTLSSCDYVEFLSSFFSEFLYVFFIDLRT